MSDYLAKMIFHGFRVYYPGRNIEFPNIYHISCDEEYAICGVEIDQVNPISNDRGWFQKGGSLEEKIMRDLVNPPLVHYFCEQCHKRYTEFLAFKAQV